jgi:hypothetical protein
MTGIKMLCGTPERRSLWKLKKTVSLWKKWIELSSYDCNS